MTTDTTAVVIDVIANYVGSAPNSITSDTNLEDELGLDSTEMVCIAVVLEKQLGMNLKGIRFGDLATPTDVAKAIDSRRSTEAAA